MPALALMTGWFLSMKTLLKKTSAMHSMRTRWLAKSSVAILAPDHGPRHVLMSYHHQADFPNNLVQRLRISWQPSIVMILR